MEDRSKKRNVLFLVLVLLFVTIYYFFIAEGSPAFRFSAENRTFEFTGAKDTAAQFSVDELTRLEFIWTDPVDFGKAAGGGEVLGGVLYGTWENDELGQYEAFVTKRIPAYIVAADGKKTAIFNTGNAETTRSLYEQLDAFRKSLEE